MSSSSSNLKAAGEQNEKKEEDGDPNRQSTAASKQVKKMSRWRIIFNKLKSNGDISPRKEADAGNPPEAEAEAEAPAKSQADSLVQLIEADLAHMHGEAHALKVYNDQLSHDLQALEYFFEMVKIDNKMGDKKMEALNKLRTRLMKVKLAIPSNSKYKIGDDKKEQQKNLKFISEVEQSICGEDSRKIPQLHNSPLFRTSMEFKDFEARFEELEYRAKLCLLCFSIFPQGAIVKRRLMLQWWLVEGFASTPQVAHRYFKILMDKGFIEAVNPNRSLSVGSCRIHPFHRSALVALAERAKLFNFGSAGDPTQSFSGSFQACLMGVGLISYDDFKEKNKDKGGDPVKVIKELIQELEKLHLLMNMDEHILEFVGEWFAKMKNINILYLGRWRAQATHHIEVEDPKFLEELGNMKFVKFLSLQGVSNIIRLPNSILQLTNLDVLDLRACSNLETIPDRIHYLHKLTHLDMSECYLLADMPKGLALLANLKVLKGFFISKDNNKTTKSCTLGELQKLKHLEKLCIYTDWKEFPQNEHVVHLHEFNALTKLTITWGVGEKNEQASAKPTKQGKQGRLPPNLTKLDLKCFPVAETPDWLKLENMEGIKLKKLYIRGGKLRDLGQYQGIDEVAGGEKKWSVEELRLKYLGEIEMEWRQLQGLFPELKYLEKVNCPNLTLFPCDAKGVWIKPE